MVWFASLQTEPMATYRVWAIVESPNGRSGRNPVTSEPKLDEGRGKPCQLHPDESGWLFLGGSVATGARFRFTG